ncbi:MAG TPA: DUF929 family protein [Acidimicrobiales bacterium]|nr:DUF929 family protein [Acidimicrobiales bacterium]
MSAVQAGGGKGSGQKPGGAAGGRPASGPKPSSGARGAGKPKPTSGRPGPATKTGSGGRGGGSGGGKRPPGNYRPGAGPPQRFSPSTLAFAAVAVVVVIIVGFVIFKVTDSKKAPSGSASVAPTLTAAPASLVNEVTGVPASVANTVGLPSQDLVSPPTYKAGQPPLTIAGKPAAVFIGGEFCPYCAAERWAIIMAFSKFGTFSGLQETTSSPWDTDPSTPTFSFLHTAYTSPYLTLATSEHESNDTTGLGTRTTLQPLTPLESSLWAKYDNPEGFPFLDIGNKSFVLAPSYVPTVLSGLDQQDVASKLKNPKDPVTQSIVGTSNYLTAGICAITGQKPASVCSASVVAKAAHAIGLG